MNPKFESLVDSNQVLTPALNWININTNIIFNLHYKRKFPNEQNIIAVFM